MYKTFEFNLGRDCLRHLLNQFEIKQMHIPYYLCDVIRHTLVDEGCRPIFYHIDDSFMPTISFKEDDFILYPNYFGICGENVKKLADRYPKLIVDNAHAYYDEPTGFACFNAGHKFGHENSLLWVMTNSEKYFMPNINQDDLHKRLKEFLELHKKYFSKNLLKIDINAIISSLAHPFVYPYLAESTQEADKTVKELEKEGKTIYRYWNSLPKSFNEYKFYSRMVPIPLD